MTSPVRLPATPYEKVWGSTDTEPWFRNPAGLNIGEIWFTASDAVPILVKFLFTSAKLSIQVHPDDEYAALHENSRGKTEMWHILRAEPHSQVGIGLREAITKERLREAALSGEIEDMIQWVPAQVGDTFFVPAGTIHAIGEGLVLCEVQQLSDVTYRLYDYGRGRELHLDRSMDVSHLAPYDGRVEKVECRYFRSERLAVKASAAAKGILYIALTGQGTISGKAFQAGEAWEASPGSDPVEIESSAATFLVVS